MKYFAWAGGQIIGEYEAWRTNRPIWKTRCVYLGGRAAGDDQRDRRD